MKFCNWNACENPKRKGSLFCVKHTKVVQEGMRDFRGCIYCGSDFHSSSECQA